MVGSGRFKLKMGVGGENEYFLFHTPCVTNASFSACSIVLFTYIPVQEPSRIRESRLSLRSASLAIMNLEITITLEPKVVDPYNLGDCWSVDQDLSSAKSWSKSQGGGSVCWSLRSQKWLHQTGAGKSVVIGIFGRIVVLSANYILGPRA